MRYGKIVGTHKLTLFAISSACMLAASFLCVPALALHPDRNISQYAHTSWRTQEGLFGGKPRAIAQTTDGYLWFGTRTGLLRFDGVRFVPWTADEGRELSHSDIRALLGARDGSLWIGVANGLLRWKDRKLLRIAGISGSVNEIIEDPQRTIWIARVGAVDNLGPICRVDSPGARCFNEADGLPAGMRAIESLLEDAQGNFWMGTSDLLVRWKPGSQTVYKPPRLRSNSSAGIDGLAASPDGSLWVGVAGHGLGLQRIMQGAWKPLVTPQLDGSTLQITDLLTDRDGALWIGTGGRGIYRFYNGRVDGFHRADGLSSDFVSQFFQDKEGTLWVVTPQGVDNFRDLSVATWSAREGLTTDNAVSVAAAHDGTVWVGNSGGLDAIRHGIISSIREGQGLPGNQVTEIFEDRKRRLWVGVDNDLTLLQDGHFITIRRPDGTSIGPVQDMTEDPQNNLWVELERGRGLLRIHDFQVQEEFLSPATPSAHAVVADAEGNLWLGLDSGALARFRNGHAEIIPFPHTAGSRVRQVIARQDGSVLAATTEGVFAWRDGNTLTLTTRNGLPCDNVNGIVWDTRGNLWLYAACGLLEIEDEEMHQWWMHPKATIRFRSFDALDGVQPGNAFYKTAARSTDGRLWFANGSVLQMIDPANLAGNTIVPQVHVEEIVANRKHYSPEGVLNLPRLTQDLEIDYTALSFVAPQKVLFRYKLDGNDRDWQDAGTRRQAFYTDLKPGSYRFRVVACNNDGVWNESGAEVSFFIVPAFYQTLWFHLLCVIAAGSTIWIFYLVHLRRVTGRMHEQLATRLEERERIARELHDTLLQGFHGLMLRFQSVLKNIPAQAPARQMMASALDRADVVLLEGRQRIRDLRDADMAGNSFSETLVRWGEELAQVGPTPFSAAIVGTPRPLDPAVGSEVYQIGREALTNAFAHAFAKKIEMEITYDWAEVRLIVRDNGAGMDREILTCGRSGHWGLSGMRERAEKIGAQLSIWSHSGAGTEIDLSIPAKVAYQQLRQGSRWKRIRYREARQ
jgi:ligand-binding sensor domain-containing protein